MASAGTVSDGPWRVEWRGADRVAVLARVTQGFPHHSALEPWVTRLRGEGHTDGELALVDEATGRVVARRRLDRPPRRRAAPPPVRARRWAHRPGGPAPLAAPGGDPAPRPPDAGAADELGAAG